MIATRSGATRRSAAHARALRSVASLATAAALFATPALPRDAPKSGTTEGAFDVETAERLAALALACVDREYPNKIAHVMHSDDDVGAPRTLTPAFKGCFDWHSAVHGHWMLARIARLHPGTPIAADAKRALAVSLTEANISAEVAYLEAPGRESFERPYGLAWLLQLAAELGTWEDPDARRWSRTLAPLEDVAARRFEDWLPKLAYPIRTGEHSQTAFAFGLVLDWARARGRTAIERLLLARVETLYLEDRDCPIGYEPSGQDFLSPCLAEADLVRRVLEPAAFASWLGTFLPEIPIDGRADWLAIGVVTDPSDGKLAHLDGLNLARAWMLHGIAAGLPRGDPRLASLLGAAAIHGSSGSASVTGEHYEGGHWLASFATYLVTGRGIDGAFPGSSRPAIPAPREDSGEPPTTESTERATPPASEPATARETPPAAARETPPAATREPAPTHTVSESAPTPENAESPPRASGAIEVIELDTFFEEVVKRGRFEVAAGQSLGTWRGQAIGIAPVRVRIERERHVRRAEVLAGVVERSLAEHLEASALAPSAVVAPGADTDETVGLTARAEVSWRTSTSALSRARMYVDVRFLDPNGAEVARYAYHDFADLHDDGDDAPVVDNLERRMRSLVRAINGALRDAS